MRGFTVGFIPVHKYSIVAANAAGKPISGGLDGRFITQPLFYFAGFAIYITLGCEMRQDDGVQRLRQESARLEEAVAGLDSSERRIRSEAIRRELTASGKWLEANDAETLEKFVRQEIGLSELAEHFYGRL